MADLTELFTWTEIAQDGKEGTISCIVPFVAHMGVIPLVTRNREIAEGPFAEVAEAHHRTTGHRVRLVRWTRRQDLKDLKAK